MSGLVVDLWFHGELLRTVPFDRPALRIGRMRENDIVVDSPAVSRFHARLQLDAGRVFLEDGGSENGSLVNDRRVLGRHELAPGDRIVIGMHELRVRSRRLDEQALVDATTAPPESWTREPDVEPAERFAGTSEEHDEDEARTAARRDEEIEATSVEPATAEASAAPLFAGLIVQRDGRIDRIVPWEGDSLTVGRSGESDLVLPQDEVSRNHARFVRRGECYEVHDLGSVNGTLVNGHRADVHSLHVGDVITIEGFELTFVLDREPIIGVMKPSPPAPIPSLALPLSSEPEASSDAEWEVDALSVVESAPDLDLVDETSIPEAEMAPLGGDATIANVMLEEDSFAVAAGTEEEAEALDPESAFEIPAEPDGGDDGLDDLAFEAALEPSKELALVEPRASSRAASVQDLGSAADPARIVTLELRLRLDQISEPLRSALEEAAHHGLVLPADLRLRTD
jgi:pSer/pThr/pTyr-binding forkhead associated (FHA) protein